jgi:hypothetical protein
MWSPCVEIFWKPLLPQRHSNTSIVGIRKSLTLIAGKVLEADYNVHCPCRHPSLRVLILGGK